MHGMQVATHSRMHEALNAVLPVVAHRYLSMIPSDPKLPSLDSCAYNVQSNGKARVCRLVCPVLPNRDRPFLTMRAVTSSKSCNTSRVYVSVCCISVHMRVA
jgi:hypothetical protein